MIFIMKDSFGRNVDYMRISITDRCNLRCNYCMPLAGVELFPMSEVLTYEEICSVCKEAAELGIKKIRITGGEPLVRKDAAKLIGMIKKIPGIEEVGLTTNGVLIKENIENLVKSGVNSVNVSLDAADRDNYAKITGYDYYDRVIEGIDALRDLGIRTKINTVLTDDANYKGMLRFAKEYQTDVRFIELMPMGTAKGMNGVSYNEVIKYIDEVYPGWKWDDLNRGNGPAKYITVPDFKGAIGFISSINNKFCDGCNKIRLTACGQIKPCLCFGKAYDIKTAVRDGNMQEVRNILTKSIMDKPKEHCFENEAGITEKKKMVSIGG